MRKEHIQAISLKLSYSHNSYYVKVYHFEEARGGGEHED